MGRLLAAGAARVIVGILGLLTRAGWTAGAVLTLDAAPSMCTASTVEP
jgi:hypothetical protein